MKLILATCLILCSVSAIAAKPFDYDEYLREQAKLYPALTKQINKNFDKSLCNKVVSISGAEDGTANIAECDTGEWFRITNNPQLPFIRCAALGPWNYYLARKCRGHTY